MKRLGALVEAIRKRPGMYVGDTEAYGLYHLVYFALDAAAEHAERGGCERVFVELGDGDSVTISLAGPVLSLSELTTELAGSGRHLFGEAGFELNALSALSSELQLDGWVGKRQWRVRTRRGVWVGESRYLKRPERPPLGARQGLRIRFRPDRTIFEKAGPFRFARIALRLRELAILRPGMATHLVDRRTGHEELRRYPNGAVDFVEELSLAEGTPAEVIVVGLEWKGLRIKAAFRWSRQAFQLWSFANTVRTFRGGKHVTGFVRALGAALCAQAWSFMGERDPSRKLRSLPLSPYAFTQGLIAVVAVEGPRSKMQFLGPMKTILGIDGLDEAIAHGLAGPIKAALRARGEEMKSLLQEMRAREAQVLDQSLWE